MKQFLFGLSFLCITFAASAQAVLTGTVTDAKSGEPIPYANTFLTSKKDSTLLLGGITDDKGVFRIEQIPVGTYSLKISFIGYQSVVVNKLQLERGKRDIGTTPMEILSANLDEVVVRASKSPITYKVDRKVIDASSFPAADTAMDLLENVPSLQVDFEGKLTYRGDGTFKVYVNGHPVANGEEKLQSLNAEQIEKIEVITNPSAKYDAEGTAGIIQVILKKNKLQGYAIDATAAANSNGKYGISFSLDKKGEKGGWHTSGNFTQYDFGDYEQTSIYRNTSSGTLFEGVQKVQNVSNSTFINYIDFGFNYDITPKDLIDFTIDIKPFKQKQKNHTTYSLTEMQYDTSGNLTNSTDYDIDELYKINYRYLGGGVEYSHNFNKDKSHSLNLELVYSVALGDVPDSQVDTKATATSTEIQGYATKEKNEVIFSADASYDVPLSGNSNLSIGTKIETDHIPEITAESGQIDNNGEFIIFADMPNNQTIDFTENVYAAYATFGSKINKFEYQLGIRMEHTYRNAVYDYTLNGTQESDPYKTNFTDWFPTVHLLYSFDETMQLTANYSRRIGRPNYWSVVPLTTYNSPYTFSQGNSRLLPAYTDKYELGYKKSWDGDFISAELFTMNVQNLRQKYTRTTTDNKLIKTYENIGESWATGIELMAGVDVFSWWNANISNSLYLYELHIDIDDQKENVSEIRDAARLNNTFKLPKDFTIKWSLQYHAPFNGAQYERDGFFDSDVAIKKSFKDGLWQLTLTASNVFNSYKYKSTNAGASFSFKNDYRQKPYFGIKLAYSFDNQE